MTWLSDDALLRLRTVGSEPDLAGTPYRFIRPLGRGGMSAVFLVEDSRLGRQVAMKVLELPDSQRDLEARLRREAHVLARLEHPGIVPIHDLGTLSDGRVYYTMKFVQGRSLKDAIGPFLPLPLRLRLFEKICDPVGFAHSRGILHRDLKPTNIMIGPFGEVLVMDWGLARGLSDLDVVAGEKREIAGTPGFMAPEQERGDIEAANVDIYALGAILKFMAGVPPIPPRLDAIIAKAMALDPHSRYSSAGALAEDVSAFLTNSFISAFPETIATRAQRILSRHKVAIGLVLTYLVVRVALILWIKP